MKVAVLFAIIGCLVLAQTADPRHTGQMSNGRAWRDFTQAEKIGYVLAFADASYYDALVGMGARSGRAGSPFKLTTGFSPSDYIEKTEKLYGDAANLNIPLPFALRYSSVELAGKKTAQELEVDLLDLRQLAKTLAQ